MKGKKQTSKTRSIDEIDASIKKAKSEFESKYQPKESSSTSAGEAMKIATELLAGVIVGTFVGYYIDKFLDTLPLFLIICFFLGSAGGALNIYRMATKDLDPEE